MEAKRRYINKLIETMHQYASRSPEARELIAELEFVWEQVKSNVSSHGAGDGEQRLYGNASVTSAMRTIGSFSPEGHRQEGEEEEEEKEEEEEANDEDEEEYDTEDARTRYIGPEELKPAQDKDLVSN